jgi:flavin reductase (DIM6/NTAB) family NADH-FMN oxidoreductase RutF
LVQFQKVECQTWAIISSVTHLSSSPAFMGFILRPSYEVRRHTFENIEETKHFTINQVSIPYIEQAHYTSAKFDAETSEFEACDFTEQRLVDFPVPFVKESMLKIGLAFKEYIPIPLNDTALVVGEVEHVIIEDSAMLDTGIIDFEKLNAAGVSGLNSYYSVHSIKRFPYARVSELPNFKKSEKS